MKITLGSSSPRRKDLLTAIGLEFEVFSPDIDETPVREESPTEYVHRLAKEKALETSRYFPDSLIIAGDLVVEFDDEIIGKISNREDAENLIHRYQNKPQYLRGGYAIYWKGEFVSSGVETSTIEFGNISDTQIKYYYDNFEWQDKAGGYALQDGALSFVRSISGSHSNIIGLPVIKIVEVLNGLGFDFDVEVVIKYDKSLLLDLD